MENDYIIYNGELYHYGRKGMRWGQNIFGKVKNWRTSRKRAKNLKTARKVKAERQKLIESGKLSSKKMTEKELKNGINRLELEKKYNDLLRDTTKATSSRGQTFVNKFLDSTVDKIAENATADVVSQAVKVLIVKATNKAIGDEVVFTNNKKKS